jgi:hypothetical protein
MGEESGVSDHSMIGSNSHPFNMPCPVKDLESFGHVERALFKSLAELHHLHDARRVGEEDSAGMHRLCRMGNDLPWLWKVKDYAVEISFVDSVVTITQLNAVTIEYIRPKKRLDIFFRSIGKVFAKFVTDDVSSGSQHRH